MVDSCDKSWANDILRWTINKVLFSKEVRITHQYFYNTVAIAENSIKLLRINGFIWQADRVRNHLNRWKKNIKSVYKPEGFDTLDKREREVP